MFYSDRDWGDIPEEFARKRRYRLFLAASGMEEVRLLRSDFYCWNSPKHGRIYDTINDSTEGWLDHVSAWVLGNTCVLLIEAYHHNTPEHYQHDQLHCRAVPLEVSPYCGGWDSEKGSLPGSRSVLVTTSLKARHLDQIYENLKDVAASSPEWNYVGGGQ